MFFFFFFFKQKTAYEMRISDWSSDVCSSDLSRTVQAGSTAAPPPSPAHRTGPAAAGHRHLSSWQSDRRPLPHAGPEARRRSTTDPAARARNRGTTPCFPAVGADPVAADDVRSTDLQPRLPKRRMLVGDRGSYR